MLIIFMSFSSFGKNLPKPGVVSGKVIDKITHEPLPYVNIIIKDARQKIITGGITNEAGKFTLRNIPFGKNILEVQFIGYTIFTKVININKQNKNIKIGTISLEEDSTTLDEVEVRAETSTVTQKIDRKVINVGKDLTSAGATASELLNNVQSVSVDSQTGNISLRGNENIKVLVDGKPTNVPASQLLKQLPSSSIKSVELITNPSAKYNPEGMSGIINIILNKNANLGFNGSLNTGIEAGHYVRYNSSTNMNYKTGKINFFGNYGLNVGKRYTFGFINRTGINYQDINFINDNESHLFKIGADLYLDDKNTLSFYTTQNWFKSNSNGSVKITDSSEIITNISPNSQLSDSKNQTYNLNYKHDFDTEGHNIEFEATFSKNKTPQFFLNNDLIQTNDGSLNYFNDIFNDRSNTLVNLDYTNPISKNGKLELGIEYRANNSYNTNITNQTGFNNSSFSYDRKIYSGCINYGHQLGKLSVQLGSRIEQFNIKGIFKQEILGNETITDDIFTIYPSAFFTYNPSDENQFQLSYNKRVDRPNIQQVNPIREWSTALITSIGNAQLLPQFTNSIEFNYTRKIKGGSITIGSFYRNINDVISRATFKDTSDPSNVRQILTYQNFDDTNSYGLELSSNYKITKWWRTNASMDIYAQTQFGTNDLNNQNAPILEVKNQVFNARINNHFKATKNMSFQLFAMYRGSFENIQWKVSPMRMVNFGANYSILKGKGSLTFRVNDIFNTMRFQFQSETPFTQNGRFNWESRNTYIGFNYRFGGGKNRAKERRKRDHNEKGSGGFM